MGDPVPDGGTPLPVLRCEIRDLTGWSEGELSAVAGSDHGDVDRITALHGVVTRLGRVAGGPQALSTALDADDGRGSAVAMLRAQLWSRAFLTALDHLQGPPPGMVVPEPGRPLLAATWELGPESTHPPVVQQLHTRRKCV